MTRSKTGWAVVAVALAFTLAGCGGRTRPPRVSPAPPAAASAGPVRVATASGTRSVAMEEYVAGCILAELGPSTGAAAIERAGAVQRPRTPSPGSSRAEAGRRMREVQAILCRSFAVASRGRHASAGFDLCVTTHCQLYRPVPATEAGRAAREAAHETRGLVLAFDGRVIVPAYHSSCGGATSAADDVWSGQAVPWLTSVKEEACGRLQPWTFRVELQRLGRALASDTRLALRLPLKDVTVDRRDEGGRAASVRVQGANSVVLRGDQFRAVVSKTFGARALASTRFTVRRDQGELVFTGRGFGHGVGLCQAGGLRLASAGQSVAAILSHYFPGTRLRRLE